MKKSDRLHNSSLSRAIALWRKYKHEAEKFNESLKRELQDPEFASCYLKYALEENGVEGFIIALGNAIRANQGMSQIATETELGRESLYKAFSKSGNPQFSTVYKILSALGLQISLKPISDNESEKSSLSSHS